MLGEPKPEEEMNIDLLNVSSMLRLQVRCILILLQFVVPCITQRRIALAVWHIAQCCAKRDVWVYGKGPGLS